MASVSSPYRFYYSTSAPVTAGALAESLLGFEGVAEKSALILKKLVPGIGPIDTELLVTSIKLGSYDENFIFRLIFGKGKQAERNIEKIRKSLKLQNMDTKKIIGIAVALAILYGVYLYMQPSEPATVHIQNSFNSFGSELHLSNDELMGLLDAAIQNKEDLKKKTVQLIRPQGTEKVGDLTLSGPVEMTVPAEALQAVPQTYEKAEKDEPETELANVPLIIRALDLDNPGSGWAAVLPELDERRLPLTLTPGVNPIEPPPGKIIYGDVTVVYKVDRQGNKKPKRYILHKFTLKQRE